MIHLIYDFADAAPFLEFPAHYYQREPVITDLVARVCSLAQVGLDRPLYPETVLIAHLGVGGCHPRHADNWRWEGRYHVPNHTPQRDQSAVFYLNDEFEGGELVFDDFTFKPKPGALAVFDSFHEHEVLPVTAGVRKSLAMWFTHDRAHALNL